MKAIVSQDEATKGNDTAQPVKTLTQSESLRIGERGEFIGGPSFTERCNAVGVKCWVEKKKYRTDDCLRNLRTFISLPGDYKLVYGITYEGKDYECGDMPRDLGKVVRGIAIAKATNA